MSAFAHSAPLSVMTSVGLNHQTKSVEQIQQELEEREKTQLQFVLYLSTCFVLEIVLRVRNVLPDYDTKWNFQILTKLFTLYGVEPPPSPV